MTNCDRSDWQRARFGDLVANINEYYAPERDGLLPYVAGPHLDEGIATVTRSGSTADDDFPPTFKRMFTAGDVLLHSRNIAKIAVASTRGVTGEKLFVLRTRDPRLLSQRALVWVLRSSQLRAAMESNFTGSVNKFLNWGPLAGTMFFLPPPECQERVADLLWSAEHHRLSLLRQSVQAETAYESLLHSTLRSSSSTSVIADVVLTARAGGTPLRSIKRYYGGCIPWLKSGEVRSCGTSLPSECISEAGLDESSAWLVPVGAVLVAMYGDGKTRGEVGQVRSRLATNQAVLALVPNEAKADSRFLYHWLRSRRRELRELSGGGAQKNLTKRTVVSQPFPDVGPARQEQLARRLDELLFAGEESNRAANCAAELTQALIDKVLEAP